MVVEKVDLYGLSPEVIAKYLPAKDCKACGFDSFGAMAVALSEGTTDLAKCPELAMRMAESLAGPLSIKLDVHEADASMSTVSDKLIEVNDPGPESPVIITGNSGVTIYVLKLIFSKTPHCSAFIVPTETKGFTVDHAAALKLMTPMTIMRALTNSAVAGRVSTRTLIIPGLAAGIERQVEQMTRWKVVAGPNSGFELPAYLASIMEG